MMLPAERVYPPEWEAVKAALKAGRVPPPLDPIPPPPQPKAPVFERGDAWEGPEFRPDLPFPETELDAVRRCIGGPIKGWDETPDGNIA